ncbi:ATP-binding cassette domain-containing protein [Christensenellaceae bacterium NSJ-44]|jgi:ABC-2 type transport system ATP-binding protein|uniref:ATP-binding cassette domain-containing protein n=1 Tax=Luoshenia tenuis TaxID=2763654 RepID=A0A926CZY6_9FIRM|nr:MULTISPECIES: ATP-binding cassette domain-containing protein [Clostridia]MBC8528686.1 ATP-binding cassette domain-containing protein [Luoshenia tenuis]SCI92924.1 Lipopolysaccharide export system ATP-binding protein LptB [uncultured Clostridium sp.]
MIQIDHLSKRYGEKYAVKDASFTVEKGEILGFLGRNGAGKSTTMNIITGYISATEGSVSIDGHDVLKEPQEAKRHIGYLPEQPPLYMDMTVDEYLGFVCEIKSVERSKRKAHMAEICELVKISDMRKRLIKNLSKGYKQRVGLAQALVGNPEVLIFDEPTVGLDPKQIIEIRKLIKNLGEKHTVILSSHILPEVADVCERLVIINKGEIVAQDTLANLTRGISESSRLSLRVLGAEKEVRKALYDITGVRYVEMVGSMEPGTHDFILEADKDTDVRKMVFNTMARMNTPILTMRPMDMTLEDIFLQLTNEDKGAN